MRLQLNLQSRVVTTVAGAAVLAVLITTVGLFQAVDRLIDNAERRELDGHYSYFLGSLTKEAERAAAMASVVSTMAPVQDALAKQDREALAKLFEGGFKSLKSAQDIEQFQFHLPPAISLYRVHQPAKFGDDLSSFRKTVLAANQTMAPVIGLERGVAGLGVRGVMPVQAGGKHVGSIEFGTNFGQSFFDRFKREHKVDVALRLIDDKEIKTFAETLKDTRTFSDSDLRSIFEGGVPRVMAWDFGGNHYSVLAAPVTDYSGNRIGVVEIDVDTGWYTAARLTMRWVALAIAAVAFVVAAVIGYLSIRPLCRQLIALTGLMGKLAQGEKVMEIPSLNAKTEIGDMARAMEVFRNTAAENADLRARQEADKQLADQQRRTGMNEMAEDFERTLGGIIQGLASAAVGMKKTATEMSDAAGAANRQAQAVSSASSEASSNVQTVASATEELSASIGEISQRVNRSSQIAGKAAEEAQRTDATVRGLAQSAQAIGEVVALIDSIAGQTNLLALNATIEAARAGEHGKGFAVVASEVKTLANQTAQATENIRAQIKGIQATTGDAVAAINTIAATITEVNEIAGAIAAAVEEQGAAMREIAGSVQQAARGTEDVTINIGGVTQASGKVGSAAGDVLTASSGLVEQSDRLKNEVQAFLTKVKAA